MRVSFLTILALVSAFALSAAPAHAGGHGAAPAEGGHGEKAAKSSSGADSLYINMNPMVLPIMNERGIHEVVSVMVALEVSKSDDKDAVKKLVPRLTDAYMRALYGRLDNKTYRNGTFIDVNKLKTKLSSVTDTICGKGKVNDVLIQGVNQRVYN